ncbi:RHS repeat domain-containing protein [Paenibacillus sp. FSL R5-0914]|uniref:RHS repeat domain-containing protein n=1 Tax=Paenibacillus sp. FSL R5-0914 TaxID=2921665 RepID=UPI0030FC0CE9
MRKKTVMQKVLIIILCLIVLFPNYLMNAASSKKADNFSDSSAETIITDNYMEQNNTLPTIPIPKDITSAANAVYDSEIPKELAEIMALSFQRNTLKGYRQGLTSTPNRVDDLKREEIEKLVSAGASIVDVYWINLIAKESALAPMVILEIKKNEEKPWKDIEIQIRNKVFDVPATVKDAVYQDTFETEFSLNPLTVTDEVYGKTILKGQLDKNVGEMTTTSFTSMVNSVFYGLATQQQINQANKQQYSDRNASSEFIDPASGSLTWKENEISLPGRDGLDLNIGIMYNSNQSFAHMRDYGSYGQVKKYNYLISRYDLGMGWSFQFPSVQLVDGYIYYHDGQGAVYRVEFNGSDSLVNYTHLVGYQGKDKQFIQDNGTFRNSLSSSAYYLEYSDKKREYFASDGRLLGIVDRFGNTITFEHIDRLTYDGQTNKVISTITDSVGRIVTFDYESNLNTTDTFNGENIVLRVLNADRTEAQNVTLTKWRSETSLDGIPVGYTPYLWKIRDQIGQYSWFEYDSVPAKFHYEQKEANSYAGYNSYFRLKEVHYPLSTTNYDYDLATRNLGVYGFGEEVRIKSRNDMAKNTYNQVNYTYLGDYTGYSTYSDPNNLPETYGFSSTSTVQSTSATKGLSTTTHFNGLQQNIATITQAANGERKEARNTAFHSIFKYLPTRTTSADFAVGDNDSTANTLYTDISYTDWGAVQSQTQPLTLSQINNPNTKSKYTTSLDYEPNYHFIKSKSWYQNDSTFVSENYEYDNNGRIKSITNPKTEITNYTYELVPGDTGKISKVIEEKPMENGLVAKVTTVYGPESNYAYPTEITNNFTNISTSGQATPSFTQKKMLYDMSSGALKEETDLNGKTTKYTYDLLGRIKTISYPTITNLNGERYDVEDQFNYTSGMFNSSLFDSENQSVYMIQVNSKRKYTQKSNGAITYLSNQNQYYDGFGLLRLEENMDTGAKTQYHVDDLSRAVYVKDPVENVTTAKYNAWGQQNEAEDTYGNLYISEYHLKLRKETKYMVAASGVEAYRRTNDATLKSSYIEQNYDQWGQLLSNVTYKDWPIQNVSTKISESYSYDIAGNVLTYTDPNNNKSDEGVTTKYTYDTLNRLNSVKDSMNQITRYQYDRSGQVIHTTMQSGSSGPVVSLKSKANNELGLLYNKKDAALLSENQTYNQLGLLTQKTDRNGTVSNYQYDERNQVVISLLTGTGGNTQQNKSIFGSSGIKTDTNELYLNGTKVASQTETIDNSKRVTTLLSTNTTDYSASTGYVYDKANRTTRLTGTHSGIGTFYINYQYSMQRLNKVQTNGSATLNTTEAVNATYAYFPTGQVKTITYPTLANGTVLKTEYTYNSLNQLWTMKNSKGTKVLSSYTYLYDNNGNITSVTETLLDGTEKTTMYAYDKLNRLYSVTRPAGAGITTYAYDLQGNRQIVSDTSSISVEYADTSYTYDLKNTLTSVTKDSTSTTISYLPSGLRYQKTSGSLKTQYNYNGNGEVISETKSNGQKANYVRGDRLLVKKDVTTTTTKDYYYLYNGHGDVVQILDTNGNVVNSYSYDSWGNITNQTEGISNSFKYAGEIYDEETGLYYLRARYYDPSIGRFINEDTYEGQINNPLSLNLYTYATNNPLMYIDPTGNWNEKLGINYTINEMKNQWTSANTLSEKNYWANEAEKLRKQALQAGYSKADIMQSTDKMIPMKEIMKQANQTFPTLSAIQGFTQDLSNYVENHPGEGVALSGSMGMFRAGKISKLEVGLNFTVTTTARMENPSRFVPVQTLTSAIKYGKEMDDEKGSAAKMFYTVMYKNDQAYNLEVLYDKASNTVFHFLYTRNEIERAGLPAISKK